ncbi:type-F conjugative transfer system pilin assembly protein TrbC [Novosphingobium sp. PC22D]|uniref:type-F conjugative transfer system pilin assembly protein TrbC n=1 Tax=Novosphingobium sp. PC22D TaxID=1962403 RepID=UPI000BF0E63F|nr:type-F conjugative transfer system pilin assembly protein TrbC [Novosphingobium sp. PC22D]PEQ10344.1 type-F conjugative transfer system pilin assembly protein TrbC [Novosphingobium sp. PC22D]
MRPLIPLLLAAAACAGLAAAAGAQIALPEGSTDLDLAAIRARAAEAAADAEALAHEARARAEAVRSEATTTRDAGLEHGRRYASEARGAQEPDNDAPIDFDAMVAHAGEAARADLGQAPRFIAFASTAMPAASLKAMIGDVTRAGGVVVFRGFPQGSARAFVTALAKVAEPGSTMDGVGIDPRLFRAFHIEAVPTYVVTATDFDLCDGFDCQAAAPPHDRMSGNVTAHYALETFARGGGPGARLAAQHLDRLEGARP